MSLQKVTYGFIPTAIDGCQLWLDGADSSTLSLSGTSVTQWNDKSTALNHANIVTATPPTYSSSSKAVVFTAANSTGIRGNMNSTSTNASVFIVSSYTYNSGSVAFPRLFILGSNDSTDNNLIGQLNLIDQPGQHVATYLGNGTGNAFSVANFQSGGTISLGTPYMYTNISTYSGTAFTNLTLVNGVTGTYTSKSGTMTPNASYVGSYNRYSVGTYIYTTPGPNGDAFNGNVYEVIVYNVALTDPDRQKVEAYLAQKWSLKSSLPSDHPGLTTTFYRSDYTKTNIAKPIPYYAAFSPKSVPNCLVWFDAADSSTLGLTGTTVNTWTSKGSYTGNAAANIGTVSSGTITQNGLNVISFPAGSQITYTVAMPNQARAWFFVMRNTTQMASNKSYWLPINQSGGGQDSIVVVYGSGGSTYDIYMGPAGISITVDTLVMPEPFNIMKTYVMQNSAVSTASNAVSINGSTYTLNNNSLASGFATGSLTYSISTNWPNVGMDLCEMIVYNGEITATQRQQVESYLAQKWGLTSYLPGSHQHFTQQTGAITTVANTKFSMVGLPRVVFASSGLAITHQDGRVWKISGTGQGASMGLNTGTAMSLSIYAGSDVYNSAGGRVGLFDNGNINNAVRHAGYVMWTYTFATNNYDFAWYFVSSGSGYLIYNDYPAIGTGWQVSYDPSADRVLIVAPGDAKYGMVWNITPKVTLAYVYSSY
jgi:hypothetical protein